MEWSATATAGQASQAPGGRAWALSMLEGAWASRWVAEAQGGKELGLWNRLDTSLRSARVAFGPGRHLPEPLFSHVQERK